MPNTEVRVRAGNCPCPGKPHKFETITLLPEVSVPMGMAALAAMEQASDGADIQAVLGVIYLRYGVRAWTFLEQGEDGILPVPVTHQNIERLVTWTTGAYEVAKRGDELYSKDLFSPLAPKPPKSSPAGQTASSTSPIPDSGSTPPKPSRRSSQNGTDGQPSAGPVL